MEVLETLFMGPTFRLKSGQVIEDDYYFSPKPKLQSPFQYQTKPRDKMGT